MSTHASRATVPASANPLWPYAQPARDTVVRLAWQRIVAAAAGVVAATRKRHLLRRAERELHYLDDRMLKDIGITRSEVDSIARFGRAGRAAIKEGIWP